MDKQQEQVLIQTMKQYRRKTRAFYTSLLAGCVVGSIKGMEWPMVALICTLYATYSGLISVEKIANIVAKKGVS